MSAQQDKRPETAQLEAEECIIFEAGGDTFAVALRDVREISELLPLRQMPQTHEAFLGLANLRGEVIGVVDIRIVLKSIRNPPHEKNLLIVLDTQEGAMAILVDRVLGTQVLEEVSMPFTAEKAVKAAASYVVRICSFAGKFTPVLDLSRLLAQEEWRIAKTLGDE